MRQSMQAVLVAVLGLLLLAGGRAWANEEPAALPDYTPVSGVSGNLKSIGSDTMNNLMSNWAKSFQVFYPNVQIEIEGKGSSTAPTALIQGTAHFGPMSREMKDKEVDDFEKKFGYKPTLLRSGLDVLAVFVHKDNPVAGMSLQQVDAIFSKTRKGGMAQEIRTWGDLGLTGVWADKPISLYGRNAASGTYGFFKEHSLFGGDYKDSVKEQPGSSSVIQGIASDQFAIGYSGIGYLTADVRAVPLSQRGTDFVPANMQHAYEGDYPLTRFLMIYVNHQPGTELDPLRREFVRYILSRQGQDEVIKNGYYPLPPAVVFEEMEKFGLVPPKASH